ncbi:MAG TPA: dihydrolipoamide acetyltransferase family protein [Stellaceae bacterium]|nr:dihydrolipoamide acetyltransferase family protein [Stellaceae bacterium]
MAQRVVKLPDIGEGTTEAEIVGWLVEIGDHVDEEEPLAEVMTDKATVEIPSPVAGTVVALNGKVSEKLAVGSDLVVLETQAIEPASAPNVSPLPQSGDGSGKPLSRIAGEGGETRSGETGEGKPLAAPAVRNRARELGIDLHLVKGTGPEGRITHSDVLGYAEARERPLIPPTVAAASPQQDEIESVPLVGLRRAIAEHLQESWRRIPHFAYVEAVDVTALEELRAHLNETRAARGHLTLLPFLMRAIVNAFAEHPQVNGRFDETTGILHRSRAAHIGVATQTPAGLTVTVVHHAERLDLWQAAAEVARLAEVARGNKAKREELTGSTITITSLGALGGIVATPVINHPEVAIVGVNRIVEQPVVRGGTVVIRKMMNLSSSFDHRIVDGWEAASFIAKVKGYLEQPATLFIE